MEKNKNPIPNINPDWNLELPENHYNSLVDKSGTNHDDGYNFDEEETAPEENENSEEKDPGSAQPTESSDQNPDNI